MDNVIAFTPSQITAYILAFAAFVVALENIFKFLMKIITRARKPNADQNAQIVKLGERVSAIEEKMKAHDGYLQVDKNRLDEVEKGNRVMQESMLALINHQLDGNHVDKLKEARDNLQQYLINK